jgi:hypothetical protein
MKRLSLSLVLCLAALAVSASAQVNFITQTTTSVAVLTNDQTINVTSATGINAPSPPTTYAGTQLYVISPGNPRGETMEVRTVSGTVIGVRRGLSGIRGPLPAGATVLIGSPTWFQKYDPTGSCVTASLYSYPWVNTVTGAQSLCSTVTGTWVPSWGNPMIEAQAPTTAVASAAGLVSPSGPLFHITGTAAITGFNIPVGFVSGSFTVIPDGAFTTTNANNIAIASTGVVSKALTFTFDPATAKFYPSY